MLKIFGFLIFCFIVVNGTVKASPQAPEAHTATTMKTYDTKFDNVDLDEVLRQERLLKNYVNCLEDKGPCTPDGKMLKETLPDAMATNCSKCSDKQRNGAEKMTRFLIDNRPDDWTRLEKIYDVQGNYRKNYLAGKEKEKENENKSI